MKNKKLAVLTLTAGLSVLSAMPAFATEGGWFQDENGSFFTLSNDTTYMPSRHKDDWLWSDRDGDGVAECYYFGADSYLVVNTTVDGWQVNENGAWVVDGVIQTRTNANGDEFEGMTVNQDDWEQKLWDMNKDGKLTGDEYYNYDTCKYHITYPTDWMHDGVIIS